MSDRGTDGLLDDVVRALGVDCDPPPSRIVAASRLIDAFCEKLERRCAREVDVEAYVGAVLDVLEERESRRLFDREKFDEILGEINVSGRRGSLSEVQRPLSFETPPFAAGARVCADGDVVHVVAECLMTKTGWVVRCEGMSPLPAALFRLAPVGHEAQPAPTETKWDKKPAMARAEATNFVDHVLAARFGKTNRDVTDEILAGVYGGERKADMGNTDFAPDWGR